MRKVVLLSLIAAFSPIGEDVARDSTKTHSKDTRNVMLNAESASTPSLKAIGNGHFETFAGADWDINKHHRLSLSLVNLLMQSGAKGSIDIADTIEDPSQLKGYVMAGSYIRPFTADLSYTYRF